MIARGLGPLALALALGGASLAFAQAAERPRAAGGVRLVEAAESAPATVVGEIAAVRALDRHGYEARLAVKRVLRGPLERDAEIAIVWEELAASRAPRFARGDRILVSLEALPGHSIWLERLPDPALRARTLFVAMRGDAFLREPRAGTLDVLDHYLRLAAEQRSGATGAGYLVALVTGAEPPVAQDALARLATHGRLAEEIDAVLGERLVRGFFREDTSGAFRIALAELVGRHRLEAVRPALERRAGGDPPAPAELFAALAGLDGGLPPERSAALLASASAAQRRVAARNLQGSEAAATLERLLRRDPAPEVRAAALERLVELRGEAALEPLLGALADPAAPVRGAASRALASLGPPAVSPLLQVSDGNDPEAASAAILALSLSIAPEARAALRDIADGHPEARLRALAKIALGEGIGHRH